MNSGIIRAVKDRDHPYIITNKTFALDARLSFEARGMLIYLLAQPDDWQVQTNDLIKQSPAARDKVYRILNELESLGYLLREQERDEHGRYIRQITTVYEVPHIPDPITEKPETGLLNTEKAELNKYRVLPSNESTKEREALATQDATPPPTEEPKEKTKRATRIPYDTLPDTWRAHCQEARPDLDPDQVWADFYDYWLGAPGQKGVKQNWLATWRRWVRHEAPPSGKLSTLPRTVTGAAAYTIEEEIALMRAKELGDTSAVQRIQQQARSRAGIRV